MVERGSYLLFCSEFDSPVKCHLEAVRAVLAAEADAVWGGCIGYPGAQSRRFVRYLLRHRIRVGYSIIAYRGVSVREVRRALELREQLGQFAASAADLAPDELRQRWREGFEGGWA